MCRLQATVVTFVLAVSGDDWESSTRCRMRREAFVRDGYVKPEIQLEDAAVNALWAFVLTQIDRTDLTPEEVIGDGRGEIFGAGHDDSNSPQNIGPHCFSTTAMSKDAAEVRPLSIDAISQLLAVVHSPALRGALSCLLPEASRLRLLTYMKLTAKLSGDRPEETGRWHQDAFLYLLSREGGIDNLTILDELQEHTVTAFFAIGPVLRNMGALQYQPEVHRHPWGFAGVHKMLNFAGPPPYSVVYHEDLPVADGPTPHSVPMSAGEFTLHSLYTPHSTLPNTSPFARWSLELRFVDADWADKTWSARALTHNRSFFRHLTLGWHLGAPFVKEHLPVVEWQRLVSDFVANVSSTLVAIRK